MATTWLHEIDEMGMSPLTRASKAGRFEVANALLVREQHDDPKTFKALPELHRAACWGFEDVVEELIEDGADVMDIDPIGETALHKAVRLGRMEAARTLLENGANANQKDGLGFTALHWAAMVGNCEMTELVLAYFGDVHAREYFAGGLTPLGLAKLMGYEDIVSMLSNRCAIA